MICRASFRNLPPNRQQQSRGHSQSHTCSRPFQTQKKEEKKITSYKEVPLREVVPIPRTVFTLKPTNTVREALDMFRKNKISAAPVVEDKKCHGFVDTLDIVAFLDKVVTRPITDLFEAEESRNILTDTWRDLPLRISDFTFGHVMNIIDLSERNPFIFEFGDRSLDEVLHIMRKKIHRLALLDAQETIVGIITQTDVIRYLWENSEDWFSKSKKIIGKMEYTKPVARCSQYTPAIEAFMRMHKEKLQALAMVDDYNRLVGTISTTDLEVLGDENVKFTWLLRPAKLFVKKVRDMEGKPEDFLVKCDVITEIGDAVKKLVEAKVHRVFIVDGNVPIGVASLTDLIRALTLPLPH